MHKEYRQRLANEYHYAATRMQQEGELAKKLFYFSVFFGEAQRVLNWEWDTNLALIHLVTQQVHTQINVQTQNLGLLKTLPIDWTIVFDKLTRAASDLAIHFENAANERNKEELYRILGSLAELSFAVTGNGSYLYKKGLLKL
jgi:hypothetical protein